MYVQVHLHEHKYYPLPPNTPIDHIIACGVHGPPQTLGLSSWNVAHL